MILDHNRRKAQYERMASLALQHWRMDCALLRPAPVQQPWVPADVIRAVVHYRLLVTVAPLLDTMDAIENSLAQVR